MDIRLAILNTLDHLTMWFFWRVLKLNITIPAFAGPSEEDDSHCLICRCFG